MAKGRDTREAREQRWETWGQEGTWQDGSGRAWSRWPADAWKLRMRGCRDPGQHARVRGTPSRLGEGGTSWRWGLRRLPAPTLPPGSRVCVGSAEHRHLPPLACGCLGLWDARGRVEPRGSTTATPLGGALGAQSPSVQQVALRTRGSLRPQAPGVLLAACACTEVLRGGVKRAWALTPEGQGPCAVPAAGFPGQTLSGLAGASPSRL